MISSVLTLCRSSPFGGPRNPAFLIKRLMMGIVSTHLEPMFYFETIQTKMPLAAKDFFYEVLFEETLWDIDLSKIRYILMDRKKR
jgi:hypothetical protein